MNMSKRIAACSIEELEAAIEVKKQIAKEKEMPQPISNPDFSAIVDMAMEFVKDHAQGVRNSDSDHWFFEAVMETVYGKDYWVWHNKQN